jgi:hypothetical protein
MAAIPMKPEFGPTLGLMLEPRWRSSPRLVRAGAIAAGIGLVVLAIAVALTLESAHYSHGGSMPFSFSYRDLHRVTADPGGYVKVQSRDRDGALKYSYAVDPLHLQSYSGGLSGELPIYASGYVRELESREHGFLLQGEGRTRVNKVPGYEVLYTTQVEGRQMYGRNVLLLPERPGVRDGVTIVMLASPTASSQVSSPMEIASAGPLVDPLKTFSFG